jgi:hypothetical protein
MTGYESVRRDWWALLNWHLKINGTRPGGVPGVPGNAWTDAEFAAACNVGDKENPRNAARTVQLWLDTKRRIVSRNLLPIERALFEDNRAYTAWRRDLRNAHRDAVAYQRDPQQLYKRLRLRSSEKSNRRNRPLNKDAFLYLVREGLLMKVRKRIVISQRLFFAAIRLCREDSFVAKILVPEPDEPAAKPQQFLVGVFLGGILLRACRSKKLNKKVKQLVLEDGIHHFHELLLRKISEIGVYSIDDEDYGTDRDTLQTLLMNLIGLLSRDPSVYDVRLALYMSWRQVISSAIIDSGQETGALGDVVFQSLYVDILSLFMYAIAYDNGTVYELESRLCPDLLDPQFDPALLALND